MRWKETLRLRLRSLLFRKREGERLHAEMQFHREALVAENIAAGMSPEEARYAAMRSFGNATLMSEQAQATWGWTWLERLLQDVRSATRQIKRAPGFALVTLLILTLGIGANTTIFTLMDALLLKSLPVESPDRLVRIAMVNQQAKQDVATMPLSYSMIQSLEGRTRSFSGIFGWCGYGADLTERGAKRAYPGAMVSGNTFAVLGVRPALGRLLTADDDRPGGGPDGWVTVISHAFWVEHYHSDPAVLGRQVVLNGVGATIVGVAPPEFYGIIVTDRPDFYMPLEFEPAIRQPFGDSMLHRPAMIWLTTMARLKPGVSEAQSAAEMATISQQVLEDTLPQQVRGQPGPRDIRFAVRPGRSGWSYLRQVFREPLLLIQMLVAAVLLICCANLAGLGLARAAARQREFALRLALGAGRLRLLRQMLVESILLAFPGALLGLGFASIACRLVIRHFAGDVWSPGSTTELATRPDALILTVTAGCAIACALLFGIAPAWIASRTAPEPVLRRSDSSARQERGRLRQSFVCLELALSLALVVVAGLLSATLAALHEGSGAIHARRNFLAMVDLRPQKKGDAALTHAYWQLAERMQSAPGVRQVSAVAVPPFRGAGGGQFSAVAEGMGAPQKSIALYNEVSANFFSILGIRMLTGRDFINSDVDAHSCIVSQAAARKFFPNRPALGNTLRQYDMSLDTGRMDTSDCQIVGIVADAKLAGPHQTMIATVYRSITGAEQNPGLWNFVIEAQSLKDAKDAYRTALHALAPGKSEFDLIPLETQIDQTLSTERLLAQLSGFFAGLALLLSGIGIYGLVAWNVTQRTREIGVRMALGATRARVFVMVVRQVAVLLAIGVAAGGVAAVFAARSIRSFLFEVQPGNPAVFAAAALALVLMGLLAAMLPARRAVSVDPMRALRTE